jgi:tetratricopeptide (TPR) repeat protein
MFAIFEAYQSALLHAKAGRFDAAAGMLRIILAVRPDHADTWLYHGVLAEMAGQYRSAYDSYATAAAQDLDPARARIHIHHLIERARMRAEALEAEGRLGEAGAILGELAPVVPDLTAALRRIALARLGADVAEPPSPAQCSLLHTWIVQSEMQEAQNLQSSDPVAAAAALERMIALGIDQRELMDGLRATGRQFLAHAVEESLRLGRDDRAAALLQWAIARDPADAASAGTLDRLVRKLAEDADRLGEAGRIGPALAARRRVSALAPNFLKSRRTDADWLEARRTDSEAALRRIDELAAEGAIDAAVSAYQAATATSPDPSEPYRRLYRARRNLAEAASGRVQVAGVGAVAFETAGTVVRLTPGTGAPNGNVLVSFFRRALLVDDESEELYASSVNWESREIARIFLEHGCRVDVMDMGAASPEGVDYRTVFAADGGLTRLPNAPLRILYRTGSAPDFQNRRELARAAEFERRRGTPYRPMRMIADPAEVIASIELADRCILIGNERTRSTYAAPHAAKMTLMRVSASRLGWIKQAADYAPEEREFLWYFGLGAVLKGLDMVLDAVAEQADWRLNVVGLVQQEPQFEQAYYNELFRNPRIRLHGHLLGNSPELERLSRRCFCFVAPSASEGMSNAVATCLSIGLYPIISRETGIDLPPGCGTYLESCSREEITAAMAAARALPEAELKRQIALLQSYALEAFGRPAYARGMRQHLADWLG